MVKRYPHTATVFGPDGITVNGKYEAVTPETRIIDGRLEIQDVMEELKPDQDLKMITAKFYTQAAVWNEAKRLTVGTASFEIMDWWKLQTHSIILLK